MGASKIVCPSGVFGEGSVKEGFLSLGEFYDSILFELIGLWEGGSQIGTYMKEGLTVPPCFVEGLWGILEYKSHARHEHLLTVEEVVWRAAKEDEVRQKAFRTRPLEFFGDILSTLVIAGVRQYWVPRKE
jgi:hypothetical protein